MIILFIPRVPLVWARKFKIIYGEILPECKKPNNNLEVHWNDQTIDWKQENLGIRAFESCPAPTDTFDH